MNIRRLFRKKPPQYITIKVITDTGATTRNYVVSVRSVRWAKIGLFATLLLLLAGMFALADTYHAHRKIARLEIKAEQLRYQSHMISELREELSQIWVINERLQHMLGAGTAPKDKQAEAHALPWGVPLSRWAELRSEMKPTERPEEGISFLTAPGALVLATAQGTVVGVRWIPALGDVLVIDHGDGVRTRYASDLTFLVHPGEFVMQGQAIGVVRQTDGTRRPTLFYQVLAEGQPVNPLVAMVDSPDM